MSLSFLFLIIIFLIGINGFFIASEITLLSCRKTRIEEMSEHGNSEAKLVKDALNNIQVYLSATLLGSTIVSIALGSIAEPFLRAKIIGMFFFLPDVIKNFIVPSISFIIALFILTAIQVTLGELLPKTLVLHDPEKFCLFLIRPLKYFVELLSPVIRLLTRINGALLGILKIKKILPENAHSRQEILKILHTSKKRRKVTTSEVEMVTNIFNLRNLDTDKIMVNREKIVALDVDKTLREINRYLTNNKKQFSRYPVYKTSNLNIIGHVHVADLYKLSKQENIDKKLSDFNIFRKVLKISDDLDADEVLFQMKKNNAYAAIVTDKRQQTVGLITLADIVSKVIR